MTDAVYDYVDEQGELVFQVCRTAEKQFPQRRPDGNGGWIWNLNGTRRVLFHLPDLLVHLEENRADPIYVVEGEKDVLAIEAAGGTATCNPQGAGRWDDAFSEALRGARRVVIVADRDDPGREHARTVWNSLAEVGIVAEVVQAAHGNDAADHLEAGNGLDELELTELPGSSISGNGDSPAPAFALVAYTARELLEIPDPPEGYSLLGPLVTRGARTIIVGDSGHGKTTFALQIVHAILTGGEMLGYQAVEAGPALVVDAEQGLKSIKRSLRDARLGEREDLVYVPAPDGLALDSDLKHRAALERLIDDYKPAVVAIDPYYKCHRGDTNDERPVVDLMRALDSLRSKYAFALLLPAHPRKDQGRNGSRRKLTLDDIAGSGAIGRGAEVAVALERLNHGYARLRYLKDRDGDLPVGEAVGLVFDREEGFRLDPREEIAQEELERRLRELAADHAWRTLKEWKEALGVGQDRARTTLEHFAEEGELDYEQGPEGRHASSKCWRGAKR